MAETDDRSKLQALHDGIISCASDLAVFLVYDRPANLQRRPGVERALLSERCVSDEQLNQTIEALRDVGVYVELFAGELDLLDALANGRPQGVARDIKLIYNGIEGGVATDGFKPGRKALLPAVADAYGILCSNSHAYGCAIGRHKFHYFTILRSLGVPTPQAWHYRVDGHWAGDVSPDIGIEVIMKSTYESWSVGVSDDAPFTVDENFGILVKDLAAEIGQSVCVQEFVRGPEYCVPVFGKPELFSSRPVRAVMTKAPSDPSAIMTFADNIRPGGVRYDRSALEDAVDSAVRLTAVDAVAALELSAFARIDMRLDDDMQPWVIDVGVSPGLSLSSSAFASAAYLGFSHSEFIRIVVAATLADQRLLG